MRRVPSDRPSIAYARRAARILLRAVLPDLQRAGTGPVRCLTNRPFGGTSQKWRLRALVLPSCPLRVPVPPYRWALTSTSAFRYHDDSLTLRVGLGCLSL